MRVIAFLIIIGALALSGAVGRASAQERSFTVTMPESRWNTIARIVSKAKGQWTWEDTNPILTDIGAQIRQQITQEDQARKNSEAGTQALRAEIDRLQSELKKLKSEAPQ